MLRSLLEEYDKILERLEKVDWVTKAMIFDVLSIHDKKVLDKLIQMDEDELKKVLEKTPIEEIIDILQ